MKSVGPKLWIREVKSGVKNLTLHKLRSFLTMLGMVFGVSSVIAMLAVGEGANKEVLEEIRKLGSNNILVHSVKPVEEEGAGSERVRMSIYGLDYEDKGRIEKTIPGVKRIVPVKWLRHEGQLDNRSMELRLVGTVPGWFDLVRRDLLAGRLLQERDLERNAKVVVLTEKGARNLLATRHTVGQNLRIGGVFFEVVGIIRSEQVEAVSVQGPDRDSDAYIPMTTARGRFGDIQVRRTSGVNIREMVELNQLIIETVSIEAVEDTATAVKHLLEAFHPKGDYEVHVPLALLRQAEATKRTFNIVLGSIAGISLLVGGIGIMNIMLASVTERTREIGVRRAIGAKRHQIVRQFLIETVVLSTLGGMIGVLLGFMVPWFISYFTQMPTDVTLGSLVLSLGISMAAGILFGLYPALRAAQLDPIVALRHE